MTMRVLHTESQIATARAELVKRGVPPLESSLMLKAKATARRLRIEPGPSVGDLIKSWDVLETLRFLEANIARDAPVVDLGAYASEILLVLDTAGFSDLTGVDLNPKLGTMPAADRIRYVVADFMATGLAASHYAAITSISVIEHGYDPERLFAEVARLLRPGGWFVASFDYWPDKIDTTGTRFFDMDWLIFSRGDVETLLGIAARHGLHPVGAMETEGRDKAIEHGGYAYTFGWLALQKQV